MKKKILIILSILGVAFLFNNIRKIGIDTILDIFNNISIGKFIILLLLRAVFWNIRTLNWQIIMRQCSIKLSFWEAFRARIAGFSINYLTPSANIGGEAARVMLVNNKSKNNALPSVILDKTIELIATIFIVIIAVILAIYKIPMPMVQKYIYVGFVTFSVIAILFVVRKQNQGLLKWIISILEKMKISFKFIRNNMDKIHEIDDNISGFYKNNKKSFLIVLVLYIFQMLVWTTEIYFTINFLGLEQVTFLNSFLIISLGSIAFVMPVLPGGIGVYELTYLAIFQLLGLNTAVCMVLVITRRLIALIWAALGLIFFVKGRHRKK